MVTSAAVAGVLKDRPIVYMGLKYDKGSIEQIAAEIKRQRETKVDLVVASKNVHITDDLKFVLPFEKCFRVTGTDKQGIPVERVLDEWEMAERFADKLDDSKITHIKTPQAVPFSERGIQQISAYLKLSADYRRHLDVEGYRDMLVWNLRELLSRDDRNFLFRMLDGGVRAVLSNKYQVLDNETLYNHAIERFDKLDAQMWQARLWPEGFELFAAARHISGEVDTRRDLPGWERWKGKEGDVHNPAVRISNSETGDGGLAVWECLLRMVCVNFMTWGQVINQVHLGKINVEGLYISDRTRELELAAKWSAVMDSIEQCFDAEKFEKRILMLNDAAWHTLEKPEEAVQFFCAHYELPEDTRSAILARLLGSRDTTRFGLAQALTETAHGPDYGNAMGSALERYGADIIKMTGAAFTKVTTTAPPKKRKNGVEDPELVMSA